jgi:hypothetical protein
MGMKNLIYDSRRKAVVNGATRYIRLTCEEKNLLEQDNVSGKSIDDEDVFIRIRVGRNKKDQIYGEFWLVDASIPLEEGEDAEN